MKPSEKLQKLIDYSGLNSAELARKIGVHPQILYDILKDRTKKISETVRTKIKASFPEIDDKWLLTGRGEMLLPSTTIINGVNVVNGNNSGHISQVTGASTHANTPIEDAEAVEICSETGVHEGEPIKFVPVIPPKIAQSAEEDIWAYVNSNRVPRTPVVEQLPVYDTAYRIKSDAMAPRLRSGDYVALRYIGPRPKILNGEVYAVDLKTSGLVVRELINQPEGYKLRARQERYEDDCVTYEDVMGVYEVVGAVIMNI